MKEFPQSAKTPEILFKSAILLFSNDQIDGSLIRFNQYYDKFPQGERNAAALNYLINGSIQKRNWAETERYSRVALKDKGVQKEFSRKDLERLVAASLLYQAQALEKEGKNEESAQKYLALSREFPRSEFAPIGIYNASSLYAKMGNEEKSLSLMEDLSRKFPKSELSARASFQLAKGYEKRTNYKEAARFYEKAALRFPNVKDAPDALYNAGIFRETQGEHLLAAGNFARYVKRYPEQKDVGQMALRTAMAYDRGGNKRKAIDYYQIYIDRYNPDANQMVEALTRAGFAADAIGKSKSASKYFAQVRGLYRQNKGRLSQEAIAFSAKARMFELGKEFSSYRRIRLALPQSRMAKLLEKKATRLESLNPKIFRSRADGKP